MKSLRIGCVKYLNARPLIRDWSGSVVFDHPSDLCRKLADGDLEVALVSSFEFLRNPIYRIVDRVSISSDGPVYSVVVAHRGDISKVQEIDLDPASLTSVNLLHVLGGELGFKWRFAGPNRACEGAMSSSVSDTKAHLLIGDQAIRFRQKCERDFQFWDLGEQWKKLVGLPFVYALWLIRPEFEESETIANRLRALRDENFADLDKLIADEKEFDPEFCSQYYRKYLRFSFGEREKEGLRMFATLCAKHGLLSQRDAVLRIA
ncbi:MAG TPA: menaquinone biosynthesis protein [Candidatus Udaeobacter sp.]|nr:menaquinone biosynthesis protein [Candidatus Udaeobacter sp.]